jgi:hypothetical protein
MFYAVQDKEEQWMCKLPRIVKSQVQNNLHN